MPKLNDTQLILLSTAAQRKSGSFYPLSDTITDPARGVEALDALVTCGFANERETTDKPSIHRTDGDNGFAVFLTDEGRTAIDRGYAGADVTDATLGTVPTPGVTKAVAVFALLQREDGATLPELIDATGWLPHSTRAVLTGLRKKGHDIERCKRGTATCYKVPRER